VSQVPDQEVSVTGVAAGRADRVVAAVVAGAAGAAGGVPDEVVHPAANINKHKNPTIVRTRNFFKKKHLTYIHDNCG